MLRQSVENVILTRDGEPAALVAHGMSCFEHQVGMGPFAEAMRLSAAPGGGSRPSGRVRTGAWFRRRAATFAPAPGAEVLSMGRFAGAGISAQVGAVVSSPAPFETHVGTLGGRFVNATPMAIEEPFMDLLALSDMNLAVAFDDKDVLIGGASPEALAVVRWAEALLARGRARFLCARRLFAICDPGSVAAVAAWGGGDGDAPEGYGVRRLRSRWQADAIAA